MNAPPPAPGLSADAGERARALALMAFDVDGVLTDGRIYIGPAGEAMKAFDVRDGHGLVSLRKAGIVLAIVTGRRSEIVARRAAELGIAPDCVLQGVADKGAGLRALAQGHRFTLAQCGYMGDDVPDLTALRIAGLAATVPDAPAPLQPLAHFVASRNGGEGAARELADWILAERGATLDPLAGPA